MDKDYSDFVARMGSFDDSFSDLFGEEGSTVSLKHSEMYHDTTGHHWKWGQGKSRFGFSAKRQNSVKESKPRKELTDEQSDKAKKSLANESASIARNAKDIHGAISNIRKASQKGEDLSQYTDAQLREKVNRMNLEQNYSRLSSEKTSKGETYVSNALSIAGSVLAAGASAVTIALAVKNLRGK